MPSFDFYADADLTSVVTEVSALFPASGGAPATRVVWLGSRAPGRRLVAADGGAAITLTLSGAAAINIRLAATQMGLAAAIAGAPLALPAPIETPVPVWLALDAGGFTLGAHAASLAFAAIEEELHHG
jgi:hypothetical protein